MRIVIVADPELVNVNYRAYQPMQVLSRQGHDVRFNKLGAPRFRMAELLSADVIHIHRYRDDELVTAVRQAKARGVAIVWDDDDDVTAVPKSNPNHRLVGGSRARQVVAAVAQMVRLADVVTTPSSLLAGHFRDLGATDARVVENFLPREFGGVRIRKHEGVVVGWIAGLEHQLDYQSLKLQDIFGRLLKAHREIRFESVGLGLGLPRDRYDHTPEAPFLELARIAAGFDIGIAPLADIPFNRARSNVKLKEYAAAGLPWLASPVGSYVGMGEDHGGRLVEDDQWFEAVERLVLAARERRRLAKRGSKWARGQAMERNIGAWESVYRDAIARASST